jgi:hypothetical protein
MYSVQLLSLGISAQSMKTRVDVVAMGVPPVTGREDFARADV